MAQVRKILLLCSLLSLVSSTGHAPFSDLAEKINARRQARKEEKITISELNQLIRDAKEGSKEFERHIKRTIQSKFLKKLLLIDWLKNMIKAKMRANQASVEKQIVTIINYSQIPHIDKEIFKIKNRFWFLEAHYNIVGKHIYEGLLKLEKAIVDAFDELDSDITEIESFSMTTAISEVLQKKASENFNNISVYLDFIKQTNINYEQLRKRVFQKLTANFHSRTFRDFIYRLVQHVDERFFTRMKKTSILRKKIVVKLTDEEIRKRLVKQLATYASYNDKVPAIQKTIRTTMLHYIPIYLIHKHVVPFLIRLLNNFLNKQYLNEHFLEIGRAIDSRNYRQLFSHFLTNLRLILSPEAERLLRREEEAIRRVREEQARRDQMARAKYFQEMQKLQRGGAPQPVAAPQPQYQQPVYQQPAPPQPQPVYPQPPRYYQ